METSSFISPVCAWRYHKLLKKMLTFWHLIVMAPLMLTKNMIVVMTHLCWSVVLLFVVRSLPLSVDWKAIFICYISAKLRFKITNGSKVRWGSDTLCHVNFNVSPIFQMHYLRHFWSDLVQTQSQCAAHYLQKHVWNSAQYNQFFIEITGFQNCYVE